MAKKRFYGVAGLNGYGVYDDYDKVLESKPYIKGFRVKGFPYYRGAMDYAIDMYKQLAYGSTDIYGIYNIKRINRFYYKNPVREQNIKVKVNRKNNIDDTGARIVPFTVGIYKMKT